MVAVTAAIVKPFTPPMSGTDLVLFCPESGYIPHTQAPERISLAMQYARHYKVHLLTEPFAAEDYISLCLIGPDGRPILGQRAVHHNLSYRGLFRRETECSVADTPFGRVALMVDVDINYPDIIDMAKRQGAELILNSNFIQLYDYYPTRIEYGAVACALQSGAYVISAGSACSAAVTPKGQHIVPMGDALPFGVSVKGSLHIPLSADSALSADKAVGG